MFKTYFFKSIKLHLAIAIIMIIAGFNYAKEKINNLNINSEIAIKNDQKIINSFTISSEELQNLMEPESEKNIENKNNKNNDIEKIKKDIEQMKEDYKKVEDKKVLEKENKKIKDIVSNKKINDKKELKKEKPKEVKQEPKKEVKQELKKEAKQEIKRETNKENSKVKNEQKNSALIKDKNDSLSKEKNNYMNEIKNKIMSNWFQDHGESGWKCIVVVEQNNKGNVVNLTFDKKCNQYSNDFINSIKEAIYEAQPLPTTNNSNVFEKYIKFTFNVE